jgi:tetratricopeptide (TPR) repeat protein
LFSPLQNPNQFVAACVTIAFFPAFSVAFGHPSVADYRRMSERQPNPTLRWIAIVLAVCAGAWLSYAGVVHALASHYGASSNPDDWPRASTIEPANAENWYRLGRYRQLDFEHSDIPLAITFYRRAVELDPHSPYYKLDLASALEMNGDDAEAEKYFRAAQENYPISAEVSWRYGNFLLRQQRLPEAYAEIHRAVMVDSKLLPLAVSRAWHSDPNVRVLLDQILPNTAEGDWRALSYLIQAQEAAASLAVWNHLVGLKPRIDWRIVYAFIDLMTNQDRFGEAGSVWKQALAADGTFPGASADGSLVFDGGFESDPSNGGFGWRQQNVQGADFDFDTEEKHSGLRSARIIFDRTQNIDFGHLFQWVLVEPSTRYRFRAFLRTDHISTDSGMRFEIRDPRRTKDLDVLTSNETGTIPWTMEQTEFTTGPQTHLIYVLLRRTGGTHFDNQIGGTVWVDDVAIVPAGAPQ